MTDLNRPYHNPQDGHLTAGCSENVRLLDALTLAHQQIMALHERAVQAVLKGDFHADELLEAELKNARESASVAMDALKGHIDWHRCSG